MTMGPKRTNLFLIELVFNLFIFALCAAVCVGLLLHARRLSQESERLTQAVTLAQSAAESLRTGGTLPEVPEGYEISPLLTAEEGLVVLFGALRRLGLQVAGNPQLLNKLIKEQLDNL